MYKKFLKNNFHKVVIFASVMSSCFIGCYKTDVDISKNNEPNLSFSDDFEPQLDSSKKNNVRHCLFCDAKLEETRKMDICWSCQEVNDVINWQKDETDEYRGRCFSPSLSRCEDDQ